MVIMKRISNLADEGKGTPEKSGPIPEFQSGGVTLEVELPIFFHQSQVLRGMEWDLESWMKIFG